LKRGYNVEAVDIKTEGLKEFFGNKRCGIREPERRAVLDLKRDVC